MVFVATTHNSVYAFDADGLSATPLWTKSLLPAGATPIPETDLNSTPVKPSSWGQVKAQYR